MESEASDVERIVILRNENGVEIVEGMKDSGHCNGLMEDDDSLIYTETKNGLAIVLPYPPSVNRYWRHVGPRVLISRDGRDYRKRVEKLFMCAMSGNGTRMEFGEEDRLSISISLHPPDRRRRDLDNSLKAILDSIESAGVVADDSQFDEIFVRRHEIQKGGSAVILITRMKDNEGKHDGQCESAGALH